MESVAALRRSPDAFLLDQLRVYGPAAGMLSVLIIFAILKPTFLSIANIGNVLHQSVILIVMSFGLAVVMAMRGVDLSIAQIADGAGLIAAVLMLNGQPLWIVITVPISFGLTVGLVNGLLAAYAGIGIGCALLARAKAARDG